MIAAAEISRLLAQNIEALARISHVGWVFAGQQDAERPDA